MTERLTLQDLYDIHTATFSSTISELVRRRVSHKEKWNRDFTKLTEDTYDKHELIHAAMANLKWAIDINQIGDYDDPACEYVDDNFYRDVEKLGWDVEKFNPPDDYMNAVMDAAALLLAELERVLRREVTKNHLPFE